jgi:hypothetical protein
MSIIRHPVRRAVVALASLLLLVTTAAAGPDDKVPPGGASGTKVLFDGKSLEGWKKCDFYKAGEVKVEDGQIIMSKGVSMSGITSTRQDWPTTIYELSYEAMRLGGRDFFAAATVPVRKSYITLVNGRRRDRSLQPRWDGRLGERDDAVLPLSGQDVVPLPRPRHRQDDPLPDR